MLAKLLRTIKRKLREIANRISLRRANDSSGKPSEILTRLEEEADIARFDWPGGEKSVYPSSYRVVIPRYGHFWDAYYHYQASNAERRFERLLRKHIEDLGGTVGSIRVTIERGGLFRLCVHVEASYADVAKGTTKSFSSFTRDQNGEACRGGAGATCGDASSAEGQGPAKKAEGKGEARGPHGTEYMPMRKRTAS